MAHFKSDKQRKAAMARMKGKWATVGGKRVRVHEVPPSEKFLKMYREGKLPISPRATEVRSETVHKNRNRVWGTFTLKDGSKTHFEMTKANRTNLGAGAWFQWGNTTDNLSLTVERVEKLCSDWEEENL